MATPRDEYGQVFGLLQDHHKWFQKSLPLIASENIPSPAVREALMSDFGNRYAEGWPGERVYAGCRFIDQVEFKCIELMKKLFDAEFVDVRPISGVVSNLVLYTAFTEPGDVMMALSIPAGGHITMGKKEFGGTAGAVHGLEVEYLPLDHTELTVDVARAKKRIQTLASERRAPKLVMFGASVFPFPHPVHELSETIHSTGARVGYDAAHVAGLIAGRQFQDPLREGVDAVSLSTHKTFFGPQHGGILAREEHAERIKRAAFPGMLSNHHLHALAGVAVASAELLEFGTDYAVQIIRNAKALGQALYERGFKVLAEHKGFTQSHVILVDITDHGDGGTIEETLEKANIIINRNLLPWDIKEGRHFMHPGGIRLGVSEVTRLGMNESAMRQIAEFVGQVVMDRAPLEKVRADVSDFREDYQKVHYCFENNTEAYKYLKIR